MEILGNHIFLSNRVFFLSFTREYDWDLCLTFLTKATPDSSIFFESFLTLTILWQSSASFWSVRSGSFSYFDKTLRLISAFFADTRPCANIRHLKLSADNSPSLKSSQFYWRPRQTLNNNHCPFLLSWDISIFCGIETFWSWRILTVI